MIKAVIFDMDGLMFDSETVGLKFAEKMLEGYPYEYNHELNMRIIGTNAKNCEREYMKTYGNEFPYAEMMERKREMLVEFYEKNEIPTKKGLLELLEYLKKERFRIGVATSTYREKAEYMLKKAGIHSFFDSMVFGDEVFESKPDPEIFEKSIEKLGVLPEEAIVLEDSENGLIAAQKAGIPTVFIKDLVEPREDVVAQTVCCPASLLEVIEYIKKSNSDK